MPSNLLAKAAEWLEQKRSQYATLPVEYVRGSLLLAVPATIGKTIFEVDDGYGVLLQSESRDYLILAADLMLDNQPIVPQHGDRIREVQGDTTFVYEVTAPGKQPCWRYSDPYRNALRIHTRQVESN